MDKAHEWTEEQMSKLTNKFKGVYKEAQDIAQERLDEYLEKFKKQDEEKREALKKGEISKEQYKNWRKNKLLRKSQLSGTLSEMAKAYNNADILAMGYLSGALPMVFGANFDFGASEIFGMKWSFKLYDQRTIARLIAADPKLLPDPAPNKYQNLDWYRKKLNSAVTQGILHGDSIPDIAKQLNSVTQSGMAAATRNARTAVTGAECAGRDESYRMAQEDGVELVREWIATLDGRTRHSHAAIDGETREVGEAFSNGCMYPGDPGGAPAEVYNCRCTITGRVKGYEKYHQRGKYGNGKLGNETYDEWKQRHIEALEAEKAKKSGTGLKNGESSSIIKSNRTGGKSPAEHFVTASGKIDPIDSKAVKAELDKFISENIDSKTEKCLVISKSGEMFTVHGDKYTVNTELLGNTMSGSTNIHNHVKGMSQYSFSYDDLKSSISDGTKQAIAFDEKYIYSMSKYPVGITEDKIYAVYEQAKNSVMTDLFENPAKILEGDEQHERIKRACEALGIEYERKEIT